MRILPEEQAPGLASGEAARRLAQSGPNVIAEAKGPSHAREFAANLVHLFALLLWAGALLALLGGLPQLSAAIVAVILVNAVFAFVQEYRAERAVAALRRMLPLRVRVRRDGQAVEIASEEVVPGDLLLLAPGDRVAADADLAGASDLRVDESTLTGESYPVEPAGRVFAGTFVTAGAGEALVTATGMATRFGRIAELAQATRRERSPLERQLDRVTRLVAVLSVGIGALFGWLGPLEGLAAMASFLFAYVLAGWRPWEPLADTGTLYYEATAMTMAGIVMAQIGAGLGWRTDRRSIAAVGLLSNRLLLVGIAVEVTMVVLLAYVPGLDRVFHMSALGPWHWLFLLAWPPLMLAAEEARKAFLRRRRRGIAHEPAA